MRHDEQILVESLRRGDDAAFEQLVRTQSPRLLGMARRILGSEDEARDAVQEGMVAVFRSVDRFTGEASLGTWVYRIVMNAALMRLRSRGRRNEEAIDDLLPRYAPDGHQSDPARSWDEPQDRLLEREQTRALVRAAIERLPESYRTVVQLRDVEELDTDEVATLLGVTPNCVKVRLHRARQALRTLLAPQFARPEPERPQAPPVATPRERPGAIAATLPPPPACAPLS